MEDNQFLMNGMTKAYNRYLQSQIAGTQTKGVMGFKDVVNALDGKVNALFEKEDEESFWDKRMKRHKKYMKLYQEADKKEKIMERVFEEAAIRRMDFDGLLDAKGLAQNIDFASLLLRLGPKAGET